jgi:lipoprotein NlpI
LLAAADDPNPETKKARVCEGNFYTGELSLQRGEKDEATRLFRLAAAGCSRLSITYYAVIAEIRAYRHEP